MVCSKRLASVTEVHSDAHRTYLSLLLCKVSIREISSSPTSKLLWFKHEIVKFTILKLQDGNFSIVYNLQSPIKNASHKHALASQPNHQLL